MTIEVQADGTGALALRSDDPADVVVDGAGFVRLSPAAVGELVKMAAQAPHRLPQEDARSVLEGRPPAPAAVVSATVPA